MAMMRIISLAAICVFLQSFVTGDKVVRVIPASKHQVRILNKLESANNKVDFWTHPSRPGMAVDILIDDEDYGTFSRDMRKHGIPFTVHIQDVQALLDQSYRNAHARLSTSYHGAYHDLTAIHTKMQALANSRSDMDITVSDIGLSYEQRSMKIIEIKGQPKANKPMFFLQCGIHAREWISPATCMYIIDEMISQYDKDDSANSVTALLDKMDFVILPVLNVDGYEYTWMKKKNRLWRKNRSPTSKTNCPGVDLNRNWDYQWGGAGTSNDPCSAVYRGTNAFSEVETTNVKTYLLSQSSRLKGFIDMHAYCQMWFTPWGYSGKILPPDFTEQNRTAGIAAQAITAVHGTPYIFGSSSQILYPAAGGAEDWVYGVMGATYAFSVELRDDGTYGFLLPEGQIVPTGEETFEGIKALVAAMNV